MILSLTIGFAIKFKSLADKEKFALLYAFPFLVFILILIGNNIFKNIRNIETSASVLTFKNLITKKVDIYEINEIKGFRFNGFTHKVYLLDKNENILTSIYDPFYKDLNLFLKENKIEYLGRSKTWFSA